MSSEIKKGSSIFSVTKNGEIVEAIVTDLGEDFGDGLVDIETTFKDNSNDFEKVQIRRVFNNLTLQNGKILQQSSFFNLNDAVEYSVKILDEEESRLLKRIIEIKALKSKNKGKYIFLTGSF